MHTKKSIDKYQYKTPAVYSAPRGMAQIRKDQPMPSIYLVRKKDGIPVAKLGKKRPPEVVAKYTKSLTGRKLSEEHRKNLSRAKKKIPDFSGTSQSHNQE